MLVPLVCFLALVFLGFVVVPIIALNRRDHRFDRAQYLLESMKNDLRGWRDAHMALYAETDPNADLEPLLSRASAATARLAETSKTL